MACMRGWIQCLVGLLLGPLLATVASATTPPASGSPLQGAYVLGDSVAHGLQLTGLEQLLQERLGGTVRISFDGGRSITTPGSQIRQSALDSVEADQEHIARSGVVVIELGMNLNEKSFGDSQRTLMARLRALAPQARYFWVDIGATVSTHAALWSARNQTIYANAQPLGYQVISRYKAIFGPDADPLAITPGRNFPGWKSEAGLGGPGNVHGFDAQLASAIVAAVTGGATATPPAATAKRLNPADRAERTRCPNAPGWSAYVLGDSIAYGLHRDRLANRLGAMLGGSVRISFDTGRSIVSPGSQIKRSALESVELDQAHIARSRVIIIALGTNQVETSFSDSQRVLMQRLKELAPQARIYWIDIGATIATQAAGWSARNKVIYDNAAALGYTVISRYKAIFGPDADPMAITPGQLFPEMTSEPGYDSPGNVHGAFPELTEAILDELAGVPPYSPRGTHRLPPAHCPAQY